MRLHRAIRDKGSSSRNSTVKPVKTCLACAIPSRLPHHENRRCETVLLRPARAEAADPPPAPAAVFSLVLRIVKLRRILSPHALLSSTSSTSCADTALFALLRPPAPSEFASPTDRCPGLDGRRCSASAKRHSSRPPEVVDVEIAPGDGRCMVPALLRVGEAEGEIWILSLRLRSVPRAVLPAAPGLLSRISLPVLLPVPPLRGLGPGLDQSWPPSKDGLSMGVNGLVDGWSAACGDSLSSCTKISGTSKSCDGTAVMRLSLREAMRRRKRRDQ